MDSTVSEHSPIQRSVWIFARPIQFSTILGFQLVSHGTYPFCHWGVLVTPLNFDTIKSLLTEPTELAAESADSFVLGDMWRLSRHEEEEHKVDIIRSFKLSDIKEQWNLFSTECVGETTKTDEEINQAGTYVIREIH